MFGLRVLGDLGRNYVPSKEGQGLPHTLEPHLPSKESSKTGAGRAGAEPVAWSQEEVLGHLPGHHHVNSMEKTLCVGVREAKA